MPKMTGQVTLVNLALDALLRDLDKEFTDILVTGTREWVRTVVSIVPSWSGMSRASLKPIADLVGEPVFSSPTSGAPDRQLQGEALGEGKLNLGEGNIYSFTWKTSVFHFIYNESNNANLVGFHLRNPGPYHSRDAANQAFERAIQSRLRAVEIRFKAHIKIKRKKIG